MTSTFTTVRDVRIQKLLLEAIEDQKNSARVRAEKEHQASITAQLREYPQIGTLNSGKFYAFVGGYSDKHYFESRSLSRVIDAINAAR
jgi:hypothetical protein